MNRVAFTILAATALASVAFCLAAVLFPNK